MFKVLALCLVAACFAEAKQIPSYISLCSRSDPVKLNKCALENGRKAIPSLLKGEKSFKIPVLSPFHLDRIEINPGPSLSIKLSDVVLKGLERAELKDMKIDTKKRSIMVNLFFDWVEIESKYEIDGKVSVLPIRGKGPSHLRFEGLEIIYNLDYELMKKKDGKEYADHNLKPSVNFTVKKSKFQFDNLFEGDKTLGDQTNKFLNENAEDVVKDIGASVSETISAICTNIITRFVSVLPFDEILLP